MSGAFHLGVLSVFGDAINFIFHQQEARTGQTMVGGPDQVLHLTGQHLKVTFLALGLSVADRAADRGGPRPLPPRARPSRSLWATPAGRFRSWR